MEYKCYEANWSLSREAGSFFRTDLLCPDDDNVCPHPDDDSRVDVHVEYSLKWKQKFTWRPTYDAFYCCDDIYSPSGYWDEDGGKPVLAVTLRNTSQRVLFLRIDLDLYTEGGGQRLARFDGNWIRCLPFKNPIRLLNSEYFTKEDSYGNLFLSPVWKWSRSYTFCSSLKRTSIFFRAKMIKSTLLVQHQKIGPNTLSMSLERSFHNLVFADFVICSNGQQFPCHSFVLRARSTVFATMLSPKWKEFHNGNVEFYNYLPDAVERFMWLVYGQEDFFEKFADTSMVFDVLELLHKYDVKICHGKLSQLEHSCCSVSNVGYTRVCHSEICYYFYRNYNGNSRTAISWMQRAKMYNCNLIDDWALRCALTDPFKGDSFLQSHSGMWLDVLIVSQSKYCAPLDVLTTDSINTVHVWF